VGRWATGPWGLYSGEKKLTGRLNLSKHARAAAADSSVGPKARGDAGAQLLFSSRRGAVDAVRAGGRAWNDGWVAVPGMTNALSLPI
jgi:hypothetical protein